MANKYFTPEDSGPTVDLLPLFRSVSDEACRKEMQAALAEHDELNAIALDLAIPHKAEAARDKLKAKGITVPGDDNHFRAVYLERAYPQAREHGGVAIDNQIVTKLENRATVVLYKIRSAALAVLEASTPAYPRAEAALAERLGLPAAVVFSPLHKIVHKAQDDLRADVAAPVVLRNGAPRRAVLESYFK